MRVDITVRIADPTDPEQHVEVTFQSADADRAHQPEAAAKMVQAVLRLYFEAFE